MLSLINRAYAVSGSELKNQLAIPSITSGTIWDYVALIINVALVAGAVVAVIYLVYGGLLYITAGGDAEKATKGRVAIVNAIIGIVIIALAFLIVLYVSTALRTQNP